MILHSRQSTGYVTKLIVLRRLTDPEFHNSLLEVDEQLGRRRQLQVSAAAPPPSSPVVAQEPDERRRGGAGRVRTIVARRRTRRPCLRPHHQRLCASVGLGLPAVMIEFLLFCFGVARGRSSSVRGVEAPARVFPAVPALVRLPLGPDAALAICIFFEDLLCDRFPVVVWHAALWQLLLLAAFVGESSTIESFD